MLLAWVQRTLCLGFVGDPELSNAWLPSSLFAGRRYLGCFGLPACRHHQEYSISVCGSLWPTRVGIVLDYVLERVEEPCGHTVPEAILATASFMEKAGGLGCGARVAGDQAPKNVVS